MGFPHRTDETGIERAVERARGQLSKAIQLLDRGLGQDRDSTIHEVRKRIKKARALIRLARGSVTRKSIAKADRGFRDAARPLSAVRDACVLIRTLDNLTDHPTELLPRESCAEARAALEAHRDRVAFRQLVEGDGLARALKALRSTRRRLAKWDVEGNQADPIAAYQRAYRRGRKAFGVVSADPSAEKLHDLRKRVKAFGYQLRTVESDQGGPVARLQRLADLLADELGEVHDLDILREFLVRLDASSPLIRPLDRHRLGLRRSALRRAGVVFLDKPRAFARKLENVEM